MLSTLQQSAPNKDELAIEEFKTKQDGCAIKMKVVQKQAASPYIFNRGVGSLLGKRQFSTMEGFSECLES